MASTRVYGGAYLMWVSVYNRLLFELQLARIISTSFDAHSAIVITVNFTNYDVVN